MPEPGSQQYDQQKSKIRRDLEEHGVQDDEAEARSAAAMDEAADPDGRKHVSADRSGGGERQGEPWPERPSTA